MIEYTVHFQKGTRVGARSLRMVYVEASDAEQAKKLARKEFSEPGYKLVRVDHFGNYYGRDGIVIDFEA